MISIKQIRELAERAKETNPPQLTEGKLAEATLKLCELVEHLTDIDNWDPLTIEHVLNEMDKLGLSLEE